MTLKAFIVLYLVVGVISFFFKPMSEFLGLFKEAFSENGDEALWKKTILYIIISLVLIVVFALILALFPVVLLLKTRQLIEEKNQIKRKKKRVDWWKNKYEGIDQPFSETIKVNTLPFKVSPDQIIYIEGDFCKLQNEYISKNFDRIEAIINEPNERLNKKQFQLIYIPNELKKWKENSSKFLSQLRYNNPLIRNLDQVDFNPGSDKNITANFSQTILNAIGYEGKVFSGFLRASNIESIHFNDVEFSYFSLETDNIEELEKLIWFYSHHLGSRSGGIMFSLMKEDDMIARGLLDEYADFNFNYEAHQIAENIKRDIESLKQTGFYHLVLNAISKSITSEDLQPSPKINAESFSNDLSRIVIDSDFRITLPDFGNLEIKLRPLPKALYFLFLRHPEGILLKHIFDYRSELLEIYKELNYFDNWENAVESINKLTNPTNNSINEKCSRIKEAFVSNFDDAIAQFYYITGPRGKEKKVSLDPNLIFFEYEKLRPNNSNFPKTRSKNIEESKQISQELDKKYEAAVKRMSEKKYWEAIELFDTILKINPFHFNSITMKALCHLSLGNYKESESLNTTAIEMTKKAGVAYHNRGEARLLLKKYEESKKDLSFYLKMFDNKCKESYYLRGLANMELEDFKSACQDWFNAKKLGHEKADSYLKKFPKYRVRSTKFEEKEKGPRKLAPGYYTP